jgi:catechol 2,3-dioxygenase-like lactoylglutathione lyase family enzyme
MQNLASADDGHQTRLMFGPEPGKGGTFLIPRNGRTTTNAKGAVDHIGYAVSDWDEASVRAALTAKGVALSSTDPGALSFRDPFDYDVQLTGAASSSRSAAASKGRALAIAGVSRISYTCSDVKRTAEWYARIFNLEQTDASASQVMLVADKSADAPSLVIRSRQSAGAPKRGALVNHIAYTVAGFDKERVRAELKRLGYSQPLQDGEHSFHIVDPNDFDVQISGIEMTALGG